MRRRIFFIVKSQEARGERVFYVKRRESRVKGLWARDARTKARGKSLEMFLV